MDDKMNSASGGFQQYSDMSTFDSPVGEFRVGVHVQSRERRGLKVLRSDLAGKPGFFGWYLAANTLAGEAAEFLKLSTLIAPMKSPEGKWILRRGNEHLIERPYFGSDENPAWNLFEFTEKHGKEGRGVDEAVALAVMSLVTGTLKTMHSTKMAGSQGVQITGIPHLNLKPENVLIGRDPRSQEYQVRLTDFLVAMASPLAEDHDITSRLNFASPEILQDTGYFGLSADIFSCGLLLHRLLENQDLIPDNLRRQTVIDHIHKEIPTLIKNLKLSDAKPHTRRIIQCCLTDNKAERFESMAVLHDVIDHALKGKDPAAIIKAYIKSSAVIKPQKEVEPTGPKDWSKMLKPVAYVAIALIVIAGGWWGIGSLIESNKNANLEEKRTKALQLLNRANDSDCISASQSYDLKTIIDQGERFEQSDQPDSASAIYETASVQLEEINQHCETLYGLYNQGQTIYSDQSKIDEFDLYWPVFNTQWEAAKGELLAGKFESFAVQLKIASGYLDSLSTRYIEPVEEEFRDEPEPPITVADDGERLIDDDEGEIDSEPETQYGYVPDEEEPELEPDIEIEPEIWECGDIASLQDEMYSALNGMGLNESCWDAGQAHIANAINACKQNDSVWFYAEEKNLYAMADKPDCATTICQEERAIVDSAGSSLAAFKKQFTGVPYEQNSSYKEAVNSLTKARQFIQNPDDCKKALFNATSAINSLKMVKPCKSIMGQVNDFEACLDRRSDIKGAFDTSLESLYSLLAKCDCERAGTELDNMKNVLDSSYGGCVPAKVIEVAVSTTPPPPPPPPIYTFNECAKRYRNGDDSAWVYCERVSEADSMHKQAMKMFIIAAGRSGKYSPEFRTRMQKAYDQSSVSLTWSEENALTNITMTCVYGWDWSDFNSRRAWEYFNKSYDMGNMVTELPDWWKALLIAARYHFRHWEQRPSDSELRRMVIESSRNFYNYLDEHSEIPGAESFKNEVTGYIDRVKSSN